MTLLTRSALALLAAGLAAGCDALSPNDREDTHERLPSVLGFDNDTNSETAGRVTLADTVAVNAPAALTAITVGGGCTREGDTEVDAAPLAADVRVYDYFPRPSSRLVCTLELGAIRHEATLRFTQPGIATVRVHGRRGAGSAPFVVTRTVVVR